MKIINLTPYKISCSGKTFEPSGYVAKAHYDITHRGDVNGMPLIAKIFNNIVNLPEPKPDTMYIVVSNVREHCKNRKDVMSPSKFIKNEKNEIVGTTAFEVNI
jgi:hypothetical protein